MGGVEGGEVWSMTIGATGMSVSLSGVSTGRTLVPHVGALVPTSAKAGVRMEGEEEGAGESMWR